MKPDLTDPTPEEIERRAGELARRLLNTPPAPRPAKGRADAKESASENKDGQDQPPSDSEAR